MPRWSSSSGRLYAAAVGSSSYSMLLLLLLIGAATVYVVAFVRRTRGHDEAFLPPKYVFEKRRQKMFQ